MSSLWDEIKDLFKTDKQLEEERQQKINSALEKESDVSKRLAELEKQYNDSLPKDEEIDFDKIFPTQSGLKEIEYAPESDEDIAKRAQSAIESKKNKSQTKIKDKYQEAVDALNEDKVSARESLADSYSNLSKLYDELKEKANNDSIRRGLGRSSVATNRIDELDKQHFSSATDVEKAYAREVANIESEISKLQRDKDDALEQLDLKSAADLDESIAKLKSERKNTRSITTTCARRTRVFKKTGKRKSTHTSRRRKRKRKPKKKSNKSMKASTVTAVKNLKTIRKDTASRTTFTARFLPILQWTHSKRRLV